MVEIVVVDGRKALVADESISKVKGRGAISPYTEVWGPGGSGSIETLEPADELVARLHIAKHLAVLHVPNGEPVWVKAASVSMLRPATPFEHGRIAPFVNSVVILSGRPQGLMEDFETARAILSAGGTLQRFSIDGFEVEGLGPDSSVPAPSGTFAPWAGE